MNSLRFQHVYYGLLALAAMFAFVIPSRASDRLRANVQTLFWPVARPAHLIGLRVSHLRSPSVVRDEGARDPETPRDRSALIAENSTLRVQLANLSGRIAQLEALDKVLASVGDVRALCERFSVVGTSADASPRDLLHIAASSLQDVSPRMPVLYGDPSGGAAATGGGIAGLVDRVEAGGATVKLITDRSFGVRVGFARFVQKSDGAIEFVMIAAPRVLAVGDGNGRLSIANLSWQQAKDSALREGDWVVLDDEDWPAVMQRYRIGRIEKIEPAAKGAGYPLIKIIPPVTLTSLRDVMVMVRTK